MNFFIRLECLLFIIELHTHLRVFNAEVFKIN